MKNLVKLFVLVIAFATFSTSLVQAQIGRTTIAAAPTTPASVVKLYVNATNPCGVGFSMTSNEGINATKGDLLAFAAPTATWSLGAFKKDKGSCSTLTSQPAKRYWSTKTDGKYSQNPFAHTKTDEVVLTLKACGNNVTAKLKTKNGNFTVKILGAVKSKKGHVLYGTYGGHNGVVAISLFKLGCPAK